jgi:hypothetical protein
MHACMSESEGERGEKNLNEYLYNKMNERGNKYKYQQSKQSKKSRREFFFN